MTSSDCLDYSDADVNDTISSLTDFDVYRLSRMMAWRTWKPVNRWMGETTMGRYMGSDW